MRGEARGAWVKEPYRRQARPVRGRRLGAPTARMGLRDGALELRESPERVGEGWVTPWRELAPRLSPTRAREDELGSVYSGHRRL